MTPPAAAPHVVISVLNWNGANKTIACLQSLTTLVYTNYRVIVVDNASTDESVARIRAAFPDVEILEADTNLGYAGGNELALNRALQDEQAALFWILNNDSAVLPDTLTAFVDAYRQHGAALYGGVTIQAAADQGEWRVNARVWENNRLRQVRNVPYQQLYPTTEPRSVEALGGSSLLIPLAVARQHGFIDPEYFLYSEDTDYCFRLRRAGVPNIEVPRAVTIHQGGGSHKSAQRDRLQPIIIYYRARNKIVLRYRHFGLLAGLKAVSVQSAYALGWLLLYPWRGIVAPRCARFTLLGILDALRGRMGKVYPPEAYLELQSEAPVAGHTANA